MLSPHANRPSTTGTSTMADQPTPQFHNDMGIPVIEIGAREFECIGATPPFDHPHIFLDMGGDTEIICPYCSTVYRRDDALAADETVPKGNLYRG